MRLIYAGDKFQSPLHLFVVLNGTAPIFSMPERKPKDVNQVNQKGNTRRAVLCYVLYIYIYIYER